MCITSSPSSSSIAITSPSSVPTPSLPAPAGPAVCFPAFDAAPAAPTGRAMALPAASAAASPSAFEATAVPSPTLAPAVPSSCYSRGGTLPRTSPPDTAARFRGPTPAINLSPLASAPLPGQESWSLPAPSVRAALCQPFPVQAAAAPSLAGLCCPCPLQASACPFPPSHTPIAPSRAAFCCPILLHASAAPSHTKLHLPLPRASVSLQVPPWTLPPSRFYVALGVARLGWGSGVGRGFERAGYSSVYFLQWGLAFLCSSLQEAAAWRWRCELLELGSRGASKGEGTPWQRPGVRGVSLGKGKKVGKAVRSGWKRG
ncbi:unnamed protein product [Closterium sp. NIES-65]|nr:unnamed protein product [Closterium sp. NIES-65]